MQKNALFAIFSKTAEKVWAQQHIFARLSPGDPKIDPNPTPFPKLTKKHFKISTSTEFCNHLINSRFLKGVKKTTPKKLKKMAKIAKEALLCTSLLRWRKPVRKQTFPRLLLTQLSLDCSGDTG